MSKIRETVAPLPIETIKEYFHDKDISFLVDYENSKIADKIFLTYVANLDIPLDIKLRKDFPKEKLFSLIDAYMDIKTICNVQTLTMMVVHILLKAIGVNTKESLSNTFMSEEMVDEFIETRKEKVSKWAHFLDS